MMPYAICRKAIGCADVMSANASIGQDDET